MCEIKIKCAVCGIKFEPKKEMRYTGKIYGMIEDILYPILGRIPPTSKRSESGG